MKYKLINPLKFDILQTVLFNRGIENLDKYLNPQKENLNPLLLDNVSRGIDLIKKHLKNNSNITILCDPDTDGYTSSAILYLYLKQIGFSDIQIIFHENKIHGLTDKKAFEEVINTKPELLIIPDASSNEYQLHNILIDYMDILVIDHHQAENTEKSKAVIINNQTSNNFPNKNLAGVGVVYKFLQQLDKEYSLNLVDGLLDLVAVGNIADVMDLNNLDTRYLVLVGLNQIYNPLLKEIEKQENFKIKTILDVAFKVSPLFNAVIRVGKMEEKKMLFDALIGKDYTIEHKYKGVKKIETVQQAIIRIAKNCKSRQNNYVKKYTEILKKQIQQNKLSDNKVLVIDITGVFEVSEISGLIATKLANEYKRPVLLLSKRGDNFYGGSGRGYGVDSFKNLCSSSKKFSLTEGHDNAFGVEISKENMDILNSIFNEKLKDVNFEISHSIDYILTGKNLRVAQIESIAELDLLWGNFIEEPLFLIKDIKINSGQVKKNGLTVSFEYNGVTFNKVFATNSFIDEFTLGKERGLVNADLSIDIICKFKRKDNFYYCEIIDYETKISQELYF